MSEYIEEEITLHELAERFLGVNDYSKPSVHDMHDLGIEVLTETNDGTKVYKPINHFLVKDSVNEYYTDGNIKVSANHRFIENGETIFAKDHPDFRKIDGRLNICDIEVEDLHSYLANGRLNHNTTSGGKALAFHSSVRIRLKGMGKIKDKNSKNKQDIIGLKVRAKLVKNRMGPPMRTADFNIFFDSGIDNYGAWLDVMKDNDIVKRGGAWYTYYFEANDDEEVKFQSTDFVELMETRKELREEIYDKICEAQILRYKSNKIDPDSLEVDESDDDNLEENEDG